MFVNGRPSVAPLAAGVVSELLGRSDIGRAMSTTPKKDTTPAICSARVKGSWRRMEHAQQATTGARKVMTVASDSGRYSSESWGFFYQYLWRRHDDWVL